MSAKSPLPPHSHAHSENHFLESRSLRDFIIGMSDGLTVPFALAAGLSGAVLSSKIIVTAGMAEIVAGCIAMGLGGYLGGKSEIEHYDSELKREYEEVEAIPEEERKEVKSLLAEYGLDENAQNTFMNSLEKDKDRWVQFMMKFELGLERPDRDQALWSAMRIGGGYVLGGIIPLSPYFFDANPHQALVESSLLTLLSLLLFGYAKSKIMGQRPVLGALKVAAIGATAALAAFGIAHLIG